MNIKNVSFRCKFSDFSSPLFVSLGSRTIRLFYQSEDCRSEAHEMLVDVKDYMRFAAEDAIRVLSDEFASQAEQDLAMKVNPFLSQILYVHSDHHSVLNPFDYPATSI